VFVQALGILAANFSGILGSHLAGIHVGVFANILVFFRGLFRRKFRGHFRVFSRTFYMISRAFSWEFLRKNFVNGKNQQKQSD
jgi:hypothetical protein